MSSTISNNHSNTDRDSSSSSNVDVSFSGLSSLVQQQQEQEQPITMTSTTTTTSTTELATTTTITTAATTTTTLLPRLATMQHRVLIYITCYNVIDGVTLTIRKIEQEVLKAGHSVCILTTNSGNPNNTNLDGTHVNRTVIFMDNAVPLPFINDPNRPDLTYCIGFAMSASVIEQINQYEPSIIHLCATDSTSLHVIQYARDKEIPIMGTYHSNIPEYTDHYPGLNWIKHILRAFFRHQYNFIQALYVPTPYIQQNLMKSENELQYVTNLQIWGRGVDVDKFNPNHRSMEFRHYLGVTDSTTPIILWVGRLVSEKRPDIFVNIIKRLQEQKCKYHAVVVGAGSNEEEIQNLPNTTFMGWLSNDTNQLSIVYASCDIFLFPSAVETFGNVTLEAAASGLPVIVEKDCSGHLVIPNRSGYICEADNEEDFYQATLLLVQNHTLRTQFGIEGRNIALQREKSKVVQEMIHNYTHVTNEFYTQYNGRHMNRDVYYKTQQPKNKTFLLGTYPQPIILIIFERIFLFLLDMTWKLSLLLIWFNQHILTRSNSNTSDKKLQPVSPTNNNSSKTTSSPNNVIKFPTSTKTRTMMSMNKNDSKKVAISNDVEIGSKDDSSSKTTTTTTTTAARSSNNNNNNMLEPLLSSAMKDSTQSTVPTSTTTTSSSSSAIITTQLTNAKKDVGIMHTFSKSLITFVSFQCRIEGRIRDMINSILWYVQQHYTNSTRRRRRGHDFVGIAKRKNSNMILNRYDASSSTTNTDLGDTSHDIDILCNSSTGSHGSNNSHNSSGSSSNTIRVRTSHDFMIVSDDE